MKKGYRIVEKYVRVPDKVRDGYTNKMAKAFILEVWEEKTLYYESWFDKTKTDWWYVQSFNTMKEAKDYHVKLLTPEVKHYL